MIRSASPFSQLSPLSARLYSTPPEPAPAPECPPAEDTIAPPAPDEAAEKPPRRSGRTLARVGLASALGVSAAAGMLFAGPIKEALVQVLPGSAAPGLSLTEQLRYRGYAGESAVEREQVARTLYENLSLFDSPSGAEDQKIGISDLQRVASDADLSPAVQDSAQALLADPVLLNALDVAQGSRVDHIISQADLERALEYENAGDFGTFSEVHARLHRSHDGTTAFDYFDELGGENEKFNWSDLQRALHSDNTPDPFKDLASELTANPIYMNAFDVASSHHDPGLLSLFDSSQYRDGVVSADNLNTIAYAPSPERGRQFGAADQAALDRVLQDGMLGSDLFRDFYQTDRGNCASTAVIKLAMDRYGANLFSRVEKLDDGSYLVTMRDGFQEQITPGELEAAATAAHYQGQHRETRSLATLSYAAMAKRAWMMGHEGAQTYGHALLSLNNGEITPHVPTYLGLKEQVRRISRAEVAQTDSAVVYGNGHAYLVRNIDGKTYGDKWGTQTPWEGKTFVNEGELQDSGFYLA